MLNYSEILIFLTEAGDIKSHGPRALKEVCPPPSLPLFSWLGLRTLITLEDEREGLPLLKNNSM